MMPMHTSRPILAYTAVLACGSIPWLGFFSSNLALLCHIAFAFRSTHWSWISNQSSTEGIVKTFSYFVLQGD